MDLQEAIEEVKRQHDGDDFIAGDFASPHMDYSFPTAIATILNAVVKGELNHDGS